MLTIAKKLTKLSHVFTKINGASALDHSSIFSKLTHFTNLVFSICLSPKGNWSLLGCSELPLGSVSKPQRCASAGDTWFLPII